MTLQGLRHTVPRAWPRGERILTLNANGKRNQGNAKKLPGNLFLTKMVL